MPDLNMRHCESWEATYNIRNLHQMKIQVDKAYIEFLLGGCYEYERKDESKLF